MKKVFKRLKLIFLSIALVLMTATLLSCFKRSYKITFLNYNAEVLEVAPTIKGEIPVYSGKTPTKPSDAQYTYVFDGWDPELKEATEDTFYRAVFKEITNKYTVSFDVEGVNPQEVAYGARAFKPIDPTKSGYEFVGWYNDDTLYDFNLPINGNISLKAKWNLIDYSITYNLDGGSLTEGKTNPTSYNILTDTFTLNNPYKVGAEFVGWTSNSISTPNLEVTITKGSTGDLAFTANYSNNIYTVTFDVEGVDNQELTYGEKITKPTDPTKLGYEFGGWYNGESLFDFETPVTSNIDLKAKWTIVEYSISYDLAGGSLAEGKTNPDKYTVETDTFTLNNPAKTGYTFIGWTSSGVTTPTTEITISKGTTGNLAFTANFTINKFTITFDVEGIDNQEVEYNAKAIKPTDPTKSGYEFGGWLNGEEVFDFNTSITSNIDLKAKWTIVEYTITYDLAGGSLADGKTNPDKYTVETESFTLNNPAKDNFIFIGWISNSITTPTTEVTISKGSTGNLAFTANFVSNKVTVTFDVEGIDNQEVAYGAKATKPADPSKTGYEFGGWLNGTEVFDFATPVTSNLDLKAKWIIIEYSITYDLASGSLPQGKTNPAKYTIETDAFTLVNPVKNGYTFKGWTSSSITTPTLEVTISKGSTGNLTFTANYDINTYNITYILNNGEVLTPNPATYTVETETFTLNNPSKDYYNFIGWTSSTITTPQLEVSVAVGSFGDLAFTANYSPINYEITYELASGSLPQGESNLESYNVETEAFTLNNPVRTGYNFAGWTGTDLASATIDVTIALGSHGARSYTATWTPITYTVKFDKTDAPVIGDPDTNVLPNQTFTYGQAQNLTFVNVGVNIKYANMELKGWAITPEGNVVYTNGQEVINLTTTDNDEIILYAVWPKSILDCDFTLSQDTYTYDGKAHKPTVTISKGNVTLVKDTDYTVVYSNNTTDAGSATVTITGIGLYGGIINLPFTINPVSVEVTWTDDPVDGYTYNGEEQTTPTASFIINNVNVPLDLTVKKDNGNGQYNDAEFREAGTYKITAEMGKNYTTESSLEKIVTIEKAELEFVWSSVSYNGAPVLLGTDYTINGKYGSDTVYAKVDEYDKPITTYESQTNSGTYNFVVTLDGDYKDNYTGVGHITINPVYVTINWNKFTNDTYTRVYDGTTTTITASYNLGLGDVFLTVKQNNAPISSIKNAGTYILNVYGSIEDENVALDTTPGNGTQTYIITKKDITVQWDNYDTTDNCIYFDYIAAYQKPTYTLSDDLVAGENLTNNTNVSKGYDAGTYTCNLNFVGDNVTNKDNYNIIGTSVTFIIRQRVIVLEWSNTSKTYDSSPLTPQAIDRDNMIFDADLPDDTYGYDEDGVRIVVTIEDNSAVGDYTATATLTGSFSESYVISNPTCVCHITQSTQS